MARRARLAATLILSGALSGCISGPRQEAMLTAAGFLRREANSPVKLAKVEALPQRTVVATQRRSGLFYLYADAAGCGCFYVGDQGAYRRYRQIRLANHIAPMQEATAMLNEEAMADWGGAFGPLAPGW